MKKGLIALVVFAMLSVCISFAIAKGKTKAPEVPVLTEIQKVDQQINALAQRRKQYLQAVRGIDIELIKLEAIKGYILQEKAKEAESKTKDK